MGASLKKSLAALNGEKEPLDPDIARKVVYGHPPKCDPAFVEALAGQIEEDCMVGTLGLLEEEVKSMPKKVSPMPLAIMDDKEDITTLALVDKNASDDEDDDVEHEQQALVLYSPLSSSPGHQHQALGGVPAEDRLAAAYELQLSPYSKAVRQLELVNYVEQATGTSFHSFELIAATEKLQVDAVRGLLEARADPSSLGPAVRVDLDTRAGYSHSPNKGASQARGSWQLRVTALHVAAAIKKNKGHRKVVEVIDALVRYVNLKNSWGHTALTMAASRGHQDVCELLLEQEADPTIQVISESNRTTNQIAADNGFNKLSEMLAEAKAPPLIVKDVYQSVRRPSVEAAVQAAGDAESAFNGQWVKLQHPKSPTGMIWYNKLSGNFHVAKDNSTST
ncbi:hypothetical protein FOL47_007307 [Perkinsus chesapeaki]|uniref:Ankyrin Repeat n=1 Tax=Perkinsus chesapeaki TaxID=330153 RepID=A0A7J6LLC2_PERCH|nr:hypothetical protein FOL47_007307 [Perkinsus chesapeaki]